MTFETTRFDPKTTREMKSISLEEYRILYEATINLFKANKTIDKMNIIIQKKEAMIQTLKTKLDARKENSHLSPVSELKSFQKPFQRI